jgi:hypothetical protein
MYVNQTDLEAALAKANEVNDHYVLTHLTGNDPQKYMDYILQSCGAVGITGDVVILELDEIPYAQSAVYSMCVMKGNGDIDIVLAEGLNHCWRRYTICKELFHVMIDREEYRNLDVVAHTEAVSVAFPLADCHPDPAVAAELLSEIAAMEFLFPYAKRQGIMSRREQPNFPAIAQTYRIPQVLVDKYLSQHYLQALGPYSRQG